MILSIVSKIKALRLRKNMSQNNLCGDCLNRVILSKIENNRMLPSIPQLMHISEKLGMPVNYFLTDSDMQNSSEQQIGEEAIDFEALFTQEHFYDIVKSYEFEKCAFNNYSDNIKSYYIGMSYFKLNIYSEALKHLKKFVSLYKKSDSNIQKEQVLSILSVYNTLFNIMLRNKNYEKGKTYLLTAIKYLYLYNASDTLISFIIHSNLAYIYLVRNEFNSIIKLLDPFLSSHQNQQFVNIMPDIYISLNIAHYNTGNYEKSIMYIEKAIYMFLYQENYIEAGECYLNYINALRYAKRYDAAIDIVEKCKKDYLSNKVLYNRFLIQEMILNFNLHNYDRILEMAYHADLKILPKISKCNYFFMLGMVETIKGNYKSAHNYLLKCEKTFQHENYTNDLEILYQALYIISGDIEFKNKAVEYHNRAGRKNIVIESE